MKGIEDAGTLLGAASTSTDVEVRRMYLARARLILAEALEQFTVLQRMLEALEQERARTAGVK